MMIDITSRWKNKKKIQKIQKKMELFIQEEIKIMFI